MRGFVFFGGGSLRGGRVHDSVGGLGARVLRVTQELGHECGGDVALGEHCGVLGVLRGLADAFGLGELAEMRLVQRSASAFTFRLRDGRGHGSAFSTIDHICLLLCGIFRGRGCVMFLS